MCCNCCCCCSSTLGSIKYIYSSLFYLKISLICGCIKHVHVQVHVVLSSPAHMIVSGWTESGC